MELGPTLHGTPVPWPDLIRYTQARDGRCIYARMPGADLCAGVTEWDHVPCAGYNALGKKAPDNERHGVSGCAHHHRLGNPPLATTRAGRTFARQHLESREGACMTCIG